MLKYLSELSQLVRGLVSLVILAGLGIGGWLVYGNFAERRDLAADLAKKDAHIGELEQAVAAREKKIHQLDLALRLLKVEHRMAEIVVLEQAEPPAGERVKTRLQFIEVNDDGKPLSDPKVFTIDGEIVHIDAWVIKYADQLIEAGDAARSTAVCVFRRLYGEFQTPADGFPLDREGSRLVAYSRGGEMTDLEREIWANFWDYANNQAKANQLGVRANHGDAVYIKLQRGKLYKVQLRSTGELSIVTEDLPLAEGIRG